MTEGPEPPPVGATTDEIIAHSIQQERAGGWDSIPTVRYAYEIRPGMHECTWPRCSFRRASPVAMWFHVHFSKTKAHTMEGRR